MKIEIEEIKFDLSKESIETITAKKSELSPEDYNILHKAHSFYQDYCVNKKTSIGDEIKSKWREIRDYISKEDKYKNSICVFTNPDGTKILK